MPLIESALGGIAVSIFDQAVKAGQFVVKEGKGAYSKTQHVQAVMAASDAYVDNYHNRHCQVKVLPGLTKDPLDLGAIYTDVELLDEESISFFVGHDELKKTYRAKGKRSFSVMEAERIRGMKVANEKQFLMILGGPGIGKSTFLRKIGLEALKRDGELERECIPVFLELKKFSESDVDIRQKIIDEFAICKFPVAEAFVDSALAQGKLLVLFDGLDEVPSRNLNSVIENIEDFVDRHDKNSFVASCRIAAYKSSFRRFTDITIAEFNDDQIRQFIDRWFSSEEDKALETAENYWTLLSQDEHKATKELAQTPLLLTFLCLIYDREQELPIKRSSLYDKALKIILSEWSAQKRLERDPIYKGLYPELEVLMLAKIAYDSFEQDQLFFSKESVTRKISLFLSDTLDAPECLDADKVLGAIEIQQGILVQRATNTYSFSHLTLQEYLAALYIVKQQLEDELVAKHLADESWREIFLLVSSLMESRASKLLSRIHRQSQTYLRQYPKLCNLVKWAGVNKDGSSEQYQRAAMLVTALSIIMGGANVRNINSLSSKKIEPNIERLINSVISNAHNSALLSAFAEEIPYCNIVVDTNMDNSSSGIEHHFFKSSSLKSLSVALTAHEQAILTNHSSSAMWEEWGNQLTLIWLKALEIDKEAISLSLEEEESLFNYLSANELLISCQESAIGLSRTNWEALEEKLLTLD